MADIAADIPAPRASFFARHRRALLGLLAVAVFLAAWQAAFLVVPFNPLFIPKPSLMLAGLLDMIETGELVDALLASGTPFVLGLIAAAVIGVAVGIVMGWRTRVGYRSEERRV